MIKEDMLDVTNRILRNHWLVFRQDDPADFVTFIDRFRHHPKNNPDGMMPGDRMVLYAAGEPMEVVV